MLAFLEQISLIEEEQTFLEHARTLQSLEASTNEGRSFQSRMIRIPSNSRTSRRLSELEELVIATYLELIRHTFLMIVSLFLKF